MWHNRAGPAVHLVRGQHAWLLDVWVFARDNKIKLWDRLTPTKPKNSMLAQGSCSEIWKNWGHSLVPPGKSHSVYPLHSVRWQWQIVFKQEVWVSDLELWVIWGKKACALQKGIETREQNACAAWDVTTKGCERQALIFIAWRIITNSMVYSSSRQSSSLQDWFLQPGHPCMQKGNPYPTSLSICFISFSVMVRSCRQAEVFMMTMMTMT